MGKGTSRTHPHTLKALLCRDDDTNHKIIVRAKSRMDMCQLKNSNIRPATSEIFAIILKYPGREL
jgi:hypothetical protein